MGADDKPDNCSCDWSMSTRRKTDIGNGESIPGRLVRVNTDPNCPVHGGD